MALAGAGLTLLHRHRFLAILPILFAAGVMAGQGSCTGLLSCAPVAEQHLLLNTPVLARALVLVRPQRRLRGWMAVLRLEEVAHGSIRRAAADRVRLYGSGTPPELREGDRLRAWLVLSRPPRYANGTAPAIAPDRGLSGRLKSTLLIEQIWPGTGSLRRLVGDIRAFAGERLRQALTRGNASPRTTALAMALSLGIRSEMDPRLTHLLRQGGMSHILAISGLHLTALTAGLALLLRWSGGGRRRVMWSLLAGLAFYAALLPARPSILRAIAMGTVPLAGHLWGRRSTPLNLLGGVGLVLLAWSPDWARDAGFQLSFVVTAAIVHQAATPASSTGRLLLLRGAARLSAVATAAALPLTAWHFGLAVPAAILVNLVAVPLASLLVILALASLLLAAGAPVLAIPVVYLLEGAARLLYHLAEAAAALPGGAWNVPRGRTLLTLAALLVLFLPKARWRLRLPLVVITQAAIIAGLFPPAPLPPGSLVLRVLDVGQGDALLVRLPTGEAMLVDGGGRPGSTVDFGRRVTLPAVIDAGIRRLAMVVLTHPHEDHGGGLSAILEEMPVDELWLPHLDGENRLLGGLADIAVSRGVAVRVFHAGDVILRAGAQITCLSSAWSERGSDINRQSLVLHITVPEGGLLLTGDIEKAGEDRILAGLRLPPVTVLKVAHHGSRTSTTARFLDLAKPLLAVLSVGSPSPWEHPHPEVLGRLQARGIPLCRTDLHGAITVVVEHEVLSVHTSLVPCSLTEGADAP
ncbi:MAG: DNA internalization-related competence protein ComEC/Rec2 [Acidobacteria bacterium]|nr:MAG: DNA internalization-related competence protein ComEC/Rec2 [Acidobacteriota bacterium]